MYTFNDSSHEDIQALQNRVEEQSTSRNALQQLSDSLKRDADHFRDLYAEQQAQIDEMHQQVCQQFYAIRTCKQPTTHIYS